MYVCMTYIQLHTEICHTYTYIYACRVYEVLRRAAVLLKLGSTNRKPGHSASPIGSLVKPRPHECTMQNWSKLYVYIFVYLFNWEHSCIVAPPSSPSTESAGAPVLKSESANMSRICHDWEPWSRAQCACVSGNWSARSPHFIFKSSKTNVFC